MNPEKRQHVLNDARTLAASYLFLDTRHSTQRRQERNIPISEIRRAILNGTLEPERDRFSEDHHDWSYSIRGRDIDKNVIRVVIGFVPSSGHGEMLAIVTAYEV